MGWSWEENLALSDTEYDSGENHERSLKPRLELLILRLKRAPAPEGVCLGLARSGWVLTSCRKEFTIRVQVMGEDSLISWGGCHREGLGWKNNGRT